MTDIGLALSRVIDEAVALDVFQRVALIRHWPGGGRSELRPLAVAVPHLLAFPDEQETERLKAALVAGIRQMKPVARQAFVATAFDAHIPDAAAKPLFDALAALVGSIDKEMTS